MVGPDYEQLGRFTEVENTLGESVIDILGDVADDVRDLQTWLGGRPYQVNLVWTQWSGGKRGQGEEFELKTLRLMPTPLVNELASALQRELKMAGITEEGTVRVSELSPRFTEDLLSGRAVVVPEGEELPPNIQFYWEVLKPMADGTAIRRRFALDKAPEHKPDRFEWVVYLAKQSDDRERTGGLK